MAIKIKNEQEIQLMRDAGHILAKVHLEVGNALQAGMSTMEINELAEKLIRSYDCIPSFLGYCGYPASVCVSVNEEVVHGIPKPDRFIKDGDIVSLDMGVIYKGYQSDAARSYIIGNGSKELKKLLSVTKASFFAGISKARAGNYLYDISRAISEYITPYGYGIVRQLTGHGIGKDMHEDPDVPNYRKMTRGPKLLPGMTLAVEPMVNMGDWRCDFLPDGWTCLTKDRKPSAHYENTILITDGEPEILSLLPKGEE